MAPGSEPRAQVLGSLYRDAGMAQVLERALSIPADSRGVLILEGYTDGAFLRAGCQAAGRSYLLDGIHLIEAHGAKRIIVQAVLARAATELPVVALLDWDENGKKAQGQLEDLGWSKTREILSLITWPDRCPHNHPVEIEDLIPGPVSERIISGLGEEIAVTAKRSCGGSWHYEFSPQWKERAVTELPKTLKASESASLVWLAELINARLDLVSRAKAAAALHALPAP